MDEYIKFFFVILLLIIVENSLEKEAKESVLEKGSISVDK